MSELLKPYDDMTCIECGEGHVAEPALCWTCLDKRYRRAPNPDLLVLLREGRDRLVDLMSYPVAMQNIGPLAKQFAEGTIARIDAKLKEVGG